MNLILQAIKSMFRNIEQQIAKLYKKTEDLQVLSEIKPDWNQNDETAPDYIKNRTHWEEVQEVILVDNLRVEDYNNGNIPSCTFVVGQKYSVMWNGVLYKDLVCYTDGDYHIIASEDNGCPFYIDDDGGEALYVDADGDWKVSISTMQTIIHPMDKKYLPDDLRVQPDWNQNDPEAPDYIQNRPFYQQDNNVIMWDGVITEGSSYAGIEDLVDGEYIITIDGVPHTASTFWDDTDGLSLYINSEACGCELRIDRYSIFVYQTANSPLNHTLQVALIATSVKSLDAHFMPDCVLRADIDQKWTDDTKQRARDNIEAMGVNEVKANLIWDGVAQDNRYGEFKITLNQPKGFSLSKGAIIRIPFFLTAYSSNNYITFNVQSKGAKRVLEFTGTSWIVHHQLPWTNNAIRLPYLFFVYTGEYWNYMPITSIATQNGYGLVSLSNSIDNNAMDGYAATPYAVKSVRDMVENLKDDIPNLPTPSTADSGNALTVQPDGSWGLSPASGAMTVVDDGEGNLTFLNVSVSTQEV